MSKAGCLPAALSEGAERPRHRPGELCCPWLPEPPPSSFSSSSSSSPQPEHSPAAAALALRYSAVSEGTLRLLFKIVLLNTIFSSCLLIVHDGKQIQEPKEKPPSSGKTALITPSLENERNPITKGVPDNCGPGEQLSG